MWLMLKWIRKNSGNGWWCTIEEAMTNSKILYLHSKQKHMAHIELKNELPGISGLLFDFPETAKPLCDLAETLLRKPHSLSSGERELIAAYVSHKNNCNFCHSSHAAAAITHLKDEEYKLM